MKELEVRLIQDNWVTLEQLTLAGQEATRCGKSVWVALVKLGYLTEEDIAIFFAQETGIAYVRISDYKISPEVLCLVDEAFCRENLVIPLFKVKNTLFVACSNPLDTALVNSLAKLAGYDIEPLIATAHSINVALDYYWGFEDKTFALEKLMIKQAPLHGVTFWRESERLPLDIPVALKVEDETVLLNYSSPIEAHTRDISSGGTAVGLYIFLFLPKGTNLALEFKPKSSLVTSQASANETIKVKGEIVYCRMEKGQRYFLGIKFTEAGDETRNQLVQLAKAKAQRK